MVDVWRGSRLSSLLPWIVVLWIVAAAGCSNRMNVQVIRYDADPGTPWEPKQSPPAEESALCGARLVHDASSLPARCEPLGDVYVADNGSSWDCGEERVARDIEAGICRLRGDVGVVWWLNDPVSSCHQARAVAFRCQAEGDSGGGS